MFAKALFRIIENMTCLPIQLRTDFFPTEKDFRKPKDVGTASFFSRKEIRS
jgi:hypothetical protein